MSDRHQSPAYPLRLQPELKHLVEKLADIQGQSLNTWISHRLSSNIYHDGSYNITVEQIAERIKKLSSSGRRDVSPFPLRMVAVLRDVIQGFADANSRSLHQELIFRIVSSLTESEFSEVIVASSPRLGPDVLDAWARIDQAISALGTVQLADLPKALEMLEVDRRTLSRLMGYSACTQLTSDAKVEQDENLER